MKGKPQIYFKKPPKLSFWFMIVAVSASVAHGQRKATEDTQAPKKPRTIVQQHKDRKVTITQYSIAEGKIILDELRRVQEAKREERARVNRLRATNRGADQPKIFKSFVVSAEIFDDETSLVTCWPLSAGQTPLKAFSNCNWSHFMGQETFRDGDIQYSFLLLPSRVSPLPRRVGIDQDEKSIVTESPAELPNLDEVGARYMVVEGDGQEEILDFMESIHDRYDKQKKTLIHTYRERRQQAQERKRQLRLNPPRPKDIVIQFGRKEKTAQQPAEAARNRK